MSQWTFVVAAYGVTLLGTGGLLGWSVARMRQAEARADRLRERQ